MRIAEPAWAILFLLTPLREGRLRRHDGLHRAGMHFYSRPCGRGDFAASISLRSCIISTHAPAGGATGCKPYSFPNWKISTHAPAGGATRAQLDDMMRDAISTHAPAGGATEATTDAISTVYAISTHAPAGGATRGRPTSKRWQRNFYSRPCGRGDRWTRDRPSGIVRFLLTPLREGRLFTNHIRSAALIFLLTPLREGRHESCSAP